MISAPFASMLLPRAKALTRALTQTADEPVLVAEIKAELERKLATVTRSSDSPTRTRIDGYRLRQSISGAVEAQQPFEWTPWMARRPLGLDAVRACLADPRNAPVRAVHETIAGLRQRAHDDHPKTLGGWLAHLPRGSLAVVEAEAVAWATQLFCALQWSELDQPIVGADRCLGAPGSPKVTIRGRIDVEVVTNGSAESQEGLSAGLFIMMTGQPHPSAALELGLSALTAALDPRRSQPCTVVGWWPEAGRAHVMRVDHKLLLRTCHAVVEAVRSLAPPAPVGHENRAESRQTNSLERIAS